MHCYCPFPRRLFAAKLLGYSLHVVLAFLLVELALLFGRGVLVLLVLRDKVVHVALCLCELHFVHPFSSVPMQEGLAAEHGCKELSHALEHLLNRSGIACEGHRHLQAFRWNVANAHLDIVRNPFHEVARILVLNIQHLLIDLLRGHATPEQASCCQIAAMAGIGGAHHVLRVEHLLCQLRHGQRSVLLRSTRCQWCETRHEEVEARERNEIYSDLPEIAIQLPWEPQACGHATHARTDKVIQIAVSWSGQL